MEENNENKNTNEMQDENMKIDPNKARDPYSDYNTVDLSKVDLKKRYEDIKPLVNRQIIIDDRAAANDLSRTARIKSDPNKKEEPVKEVNKDMQPNSFNRKENLNSNDVFFARGMQMPDYEIVKGKDTIKVKDEFKEKRLKLGLTGPGGVILIILLIILIIMAVILITNLIRNNNRLAKINNLSYINYTETLKKEDSDILKKSVYDKLEEGFNPENNSDTDNDGITDKDEINIYHTDPRKASTSGDNIPDGYKVKNNLDLKEKYNEEGREGIFQVPENIKLENKSAENAYVVVEYKEDFKINGIQIDKGYRIHNYKGKLEINFKNLQSENKQYTVFVITPEIYNNIEEKELEDNKINIEILIPGTIIGIKEIKEDATNTYFEEIEIMDNIIGGRRALIYVETGFLRNVNNAFGKLKDYDEIVYVIEEKFDHQEGDRSKELSAKFSKLTGKKIKVEHSYSGSFIINLRKTLMDGFMYNGSIINYINNLEPKDEKGENHNKNKVSALYIYDLCEPGIWFSKGDVENLGIETIKIKENLSIPSYNGQEEYSEINGLKSYLANKNIAIANFFTFKDGEAKGLELAVYGIEESEDADTLYLLVSDNNFENNKFEDEPIINKIKITRWFYYKEGEVEERFYFDYYPVYGGEKYRWTNLNFDTNTSSLVFVDTNGKQIK